MTYDPYVPSYPAPSVEAVAPAPAARKQRQVALLAMTAVMAGLVGGGVATATARLAGAPSTGTSTSTGTGTSGASTAPAVADGSVESVAKAVLPSTVQIQMRSSDGSGDTGSGSIISADGYILTNNHVVARSPPRAAR